MSKHMGKVISFEKFENGYTKNDNEKQQIKNDLKKLINDAQLFVAPVQNHNRGQHRSDAYKIVYPIYKTAQHKETLANCFACIKCYKIFLHLRVNGSAPFKLHKCYKEYSNTLKEAELLAIEANKVAVEATAKAKSAKKAVEVLQKVDIVSLVDSSGDSDSEILHAESDQNEVVRKAMSSKKSIDQVAIAGSSGNNAMTPNLPNFHELPRYAEVIANTIESFVDMALKGKPIKADKIIDHIPDNFTNFSW